jgi:hypothetical protein
MRKAIIAATFGGVLASGFLVVSTPVASAAPCGPNANDPGGVMACVNCINRVGDNGTAQNEICYGGTEPGMNGAGGSAPVQAPQQAAPPPAPLLPYCDYACQQAQQPNRVVVMQARKNFRCVRILVN